MSFLLVLPWETLELVLLQVPFQLVLVGAKLVLEVQEIPWGVLCKINKCGIGRWIRAVHITAFQVVPCEAKCIDSCTHNHPFVEDKSV